MITPDTFIEISGFHILALQNHLVFGECDEKRDESLSVFPALGKLYSHTPASLVRFLSMGWEVWIIMNLLENCFDFNESWSLLLVKLTLSINRTDFRTKKKNDRHAWFLKNSSLALGPASCPSTQGSASFSSTSSSYWLCSSLDNLCCRSDKLGLVPLVLGV